MNKNDKGVGSERRYAGCLIVAIYIVIGLVQFLAAMKGLQIWFHLPWILAVAAAFFLAYIPIVGTIAGIKGATAAWGWELWPAIAFFCWPYAIYIVAIAFGGVADLIFKRRAEIES